MGIRGIAREIVYSGAFRNALDALGRRPRGRALLNKIGHPRGVYSNFAEAWAVAARGQHAGHDHLDSIKIHLALAERLRASDYAALFWIAQIAQPTLRVFDFGGNAGNLFYSYRPYLSERFVQVEWTVMDLPMVCEEGRKLANGRNEKNLRFTERADDAAGCDLLLVSGSFHYWERGIPEFLAQFGQKPPRILINRTPTQDKEDSYFTVQGGGSYAVPCIVRNESRLVEEFALCGYQLRDQWKVAELALRLPLFPSRTVRNYSGFYFLRSS